MNLADVLVEKREPISTIFAFALLLCLLRFVTFLSLEVLFTVVNVVDVSILSTKPRIESIGDFPVPMYSVTFGFSLVVLNS